MIGRSTAGLKPCATGVVLSALVAAGAWAQTAPPAAGPAPVKEALYQSMEWRNIGPFRGGRVTAVTGITGNPLVYLMGATGGGVWRTDDAGQSWRNVSDGFFKTGSVGAIAVADADPNVVYAGMGESPVRGVATSHGDGVYKSTDGGRSWKHVGLEATRHISMIHVHPKDADVVYVAAQGSPWGPNPERGIYRSTDGGKTWKQIHTVDSTTGASDLSMDYTNPRVLFAAYWDHQRQPWRVRSGGPGSGLYKSSDGGDTWAKLGDGLPRGVWGKVAVSVSRANPSRIWTLIEADEGGLFRSDDGGASWQKVNDDRVLRARAWYYINVFADPQDANTVWVLNAPALKSIDGGRTFQTVPTPHGDNHGLWINPANNAWIINGNDGGANVSLNGGRSWSTQGNQPTAQFYRVNTDNRFPYWVYGGQQDNTTVAIASRSFGRGIDVTEWHPVGGCESGYAAFDPNRPRYVYAGCYQGIVTEWDAETESERSVMAYHALGLGEPSNEQKYRFNWNAPIVVSRHDPTVIYHAGNLVLRSTDRGNSWSAISPDLTRNEKDKQGPGGAPITNEGAGGEVYGTVFYLAESPHDAKTLWAGTDDGLVHLTRDGGATWLPVTPKDMGPWQVNAIEVSPYDAATAYLAVTGYKLNDFSPLVYKTSDFGRTWTRLTAGLDEGSFVRVVREDPVRRDLLYAGTETGVRVSFDGGRRWQSLQLNLPVVPVTDLQIRDGDLVAATQGRAFWILDDLSPLRQLDAGSSSAAVQLFKPREAVRVDGSSGSVPGLGRNPPNGAVVYYALATAPDDQARVKLEFLDTSGRALRTVTNAEVKKVDAPTAPTPVRLTPKAGLNRFVWDLRRDPIAPAPGIFVNGSLGGYRVAPGDYQVRLTVGDTVQTQPLKVTDDPRRESAAGGYADQQAALAMVYDRVAATHESVARLRQARDQVNSLLERTHGRSQSEAIEQNGKALVESIDAWIGSAVQPRQKTFQDVINFRNQLDAHYLWVAEALDADAQVTQGVRDRLRDLDTRWQSQQAALKTVEAQLDAFNLLVKNAGVPAVVLPSTPR